MKKNIYLILAVILVFMSSFNEISFADEYSLEMVINRVVSENSSIRKINSSISELNEQVRLAKFQADQLDDVYTAYRRYKAMYNDPDKPYERIKNMTNAELMNLQVELPSRIQKLMLRGKFQRADDVTYELKFASYALMFGTDEPKLTKQELYRKFAKTIHMTGDMVEKERAKVLNNRDIIAAAISTKVTNLYINIISLQELLDLEREMLRYRIDLEHELDLLLEQGVVSKNLVWENDKQIEILQAQIELHEHQIKVLAYNLNMLLSNDIQSSNIFKKVSSNADDVLEHSIEKYVQMAQKNSALLKSYVKDLAYANKEMDLYLEYDGGKAGLYYDDLSFKVESLEQKISEVTSNLEIQVKKAYEDVVVKRELEHSARLSYEISKATLDEANKKFKLGLIKYTDVYQIKVSSINRWFQLKTAQQDLKMAEISLEVLVKYGSL